MSILVSDIIAAGDMFRRTTEANELTAAKQLEAAALAIEDVHSQANYRFTQRRETFDYLEGETDYAINEGLNVTDFKEVKDIRLTDENTFPFDFIDPNQFDTSNASFPDRCNYTVEWRDGQPILRVSQSGAGSSAALHTAADHDANGTWAVDSTNSDATNIGTDSYVYRANGGSIKFDITVAQSGNNKATISTSDMTAVDLTNYQNQGVIRMWVYIPDVADDTSDYISSVELRWGSSASAYWTVTSSKPIDSAVFQDRWNLMEFKWNEATKTGSPTVSSITHLLVTINYSASQPDDIGFRINDIRIFQPVDMEMLYFSTATVKITSTNIWKTRATVTTDILLAPDVYKPVYVAAYNYYAAHFIYPADDKRLDIYERKYGLVDPNSSKRVGGLIGRMIRQQGEREKLPLKKLTPVNRMASD